MGSRTKQKKFESKSMDNLGKLMKANTVSMQEALSSGNCDIVRKVLDEGAVAENLHEAVEKGHMEIVELLLKSQTDTTLLDRQNNLGRTALHVAVECNDERMVNLLLGYGASVSIKDCIDHTPTDAAILRKNMLLFERLVAHGGKSGCRSVLFGHLVSVLHSITGPELITLLRAGLNAHIHPTESSPTNNLLHFLITNRRFENEDLATLQEIVKLIQGDGVDINVNNISGTNPLYFAMSMFNTKMVVALLEQGADAKCAYLCSNEVMSTRRNLFLYLSLLLQYCPELTVSTLSKETHHAVLCTLLKCATVRDDPYNHKFLQMRYKIDRLSPVILLGKDPSSHLDEFVKMTSMTCPHEWLQSFDEGSLGKHNTAKKLLKEIRSEVWSLKRLANRVVRISVQMPFHKNAALLPVGTLKDVVMGKKDK